MLVKDLYAHKIPFNIECTCLFRNIKTVRCFIMNKIIFIVVLTFVSLLSIFIVKNMNVYVMTLIGTLFIDMIVLIWDIRSEFRHTQVAEHTSA